MKIPESEDRLDRVLGFLLVLPVASVVALLAWASFCLWEML